MQVSKWMWGACTSLCQLLMRFLWLRRCFWYDLSWKHDICLEGGGELLEMFQVFIFSGKEGNFLRHQVFSIWVYYQFIGLNLLVLQTREFCIVTCLCLDEIYCVSVKAEIITLRGFQHIHTHTHTHTHTHIHTYIYRVSQEECARLRESVPYVKVYRYNPKLKGCGDNGQRSLKLWQLLHTYWLPNTY